MQRCCDLHCSLLVRTSSTCPPSKPCARTFNMSSPKAVGTRNTAPAGMFQQRKHEKSCLGNLQHLLLNPWPRVLRAWKYILTIRTSSSLQNLFNKCGGHAYHHRHRYHHSHDDDHYCLLLLAIVTVAVTVAVVVIIVAVVLVVVKALTVKTNTKKW